MAKRGRPRKQAPMYGPSLPSEHEQLVAEPPDDQREHLDLPAKVSEDPASDAQNSVAAPRPGGACRVDIWSPVLTDTECMRMSWKRFSLNYRKGDCLHERRWPSKVASGCALINIAWDQLEGH